MQHEVTESRDLLGPDGRLVEEGWARRPLWRYARSRIKAGPFRIKEWDYYSVLSPEGRFGLTLTMSDLGYAGMFAACFLDLERGLYRQVDTLSVLPMGRTGFPADGDAGRVAFSDGKLSLAFECQRDQGAGGSPRDPGAGGSRRVLTFSAPTLDDGDGHVGLEGRIELYQPDALESVTIATSWAENRRAFYYNRKINCMPASGGFSIGPRSFRFDPMRDFGGLDWGRGRWTYENRWYWSSASGLAGGKPFGWNLGYGFSDRGPASENALVLDGRVHKLADVEFRYDRSDYLKPWRFVSSDGRFEMDFRPLVDRRSRTDLKLIVSDQHQVFGEFTGTAVLDDGSPVRVERFPGFAEDVFNRW